MSPISKKFLSISLLILAIGIFVRAYHFSDWLTFEIDQTYDARIVSPAVEQGPSHLTLLGPTAGGGRALRLGPAFYYFEYISAFIFGDSPAGYAGGILILSVALLPLLYLFSRKYFSRVVSLALLLFASVSTYLTLYGRFAWSPNVLPFLMLLFAYALFRALSIREPHQERWFLIAVATLVVTTQIHFNAFFIAPTVFVTLLLLIRPYYPIRTWIAAIGIILTLSLPIIISEITTHGENTRFFLERAQKGSLWYKNIPFKVAQDIQYHSSEFFFILTGIDGINGGRLRTSGFESGSELPWRVGAFVLLGTEIILLVRFFFTEKDSDRKNFLLILFLWFSVSSAYFYFLISDGYNLFPRFFLLESPLAILFFGLILTAVERYGKPPLIIALVCSAAMIVVVNLNRLSAHFSQLSGTPDKQNNIQREDIFPNTRRLTLREQSAITDYMENIHRKNNYPIYLDSYSEYIPAFWYHLNRRDITYADDIRSDALFLEANYFVVTYSSGHGIGAYDKRFLTAETHDFGVLTVYRLSPRQEYITTLRQDPTDFRKMIQVTQISGLYTWKDIFSDVPVIKHITPAPKNR